MDSAIPEPAPHTPLGGDASDALKIVVVGGFGVGKTTLVRSVSEIRPLTTEEVMTGAGAGSDQPNRLAGKHTTTVTFDFGRITLNPQMVLYLFGAPSQERFWSFWDRLFSGTLGAVVLVDVRRLQDSWYAIDRLEHHHVPFIVAHNNFTGRPYPLEKVRQALDLSDGVPLVECDARERGSSKTALISLVDHLYANSSIGRATPSP